MLIEVRRIYKKQAYTIGKMYLNGAYFCDTLEDPVRDLKKDGSGKIKGITAIPAGEYTVTVNRSPRFKRMLPYLHGVPFYEGVRIHAGNTAADTEGCILVGKNRAVGKVLDSRKFEEELTGILLNVQAAGDTIKIIIK